MRIAHVVSTFPPYKAGIGNAAYHLCWELTRLNNHVTVFTMSDRDQTTIDKSLPFQVRRMRPWFKYGNAGFVPQLLWSLNGFDIVHLHYPFFGGAEMVYLRDKMKPLNLIVHYHMDVIGEGVAHRFFAWHTKHIMPKILDAANAIIVTSMDYAKQSAIRDRFTQDSDKVNAIALGVNPEIFKPRLRSKDLTARFNLQDKKVILFVGALDRAHYFKGVNYLIKAFQLISSNDEYRLVIVGGGNLLKTYQTIATNYGLDRKVIFAGYVADDVLPLYYNLGDIFVLPSVDSSEAFGIAILEAMSSGLPVIASDLPGVRSVVVKDVTGTLVKPKQVNALAQSMLYLLKNPQIQNKWGSRGRQRVLEQYTWQQVGKNVNQLYQEYLA